MIEINIKIAAGTTVEALNDLRALANSVSYANVASSVTDASHDLAILKVLGTPTAHAAAPAPVNYETPKGEGFEDTSKELDRAISTILRNAPETPAAPQPEEPKKRGRKPKEVAPAPEQQAEVGQVYEQKPEQVTEQFIETLTEVAEAAQEAAAQVQEQTEAAYVVASEATAPAPAEQPKVTLAEMRAHCAELVKSDPSQRERIKNALSTLGYESLTAIGENAAVLSQFKQAISN